MGICMDTEASAQKATTIEDNEDSELNQKIGEWRGGGQQGSQIITRSPKSGNRMANVGKVKFQPPNVPVIFVLGGPGSGKVTHCDTLMQEKRGVTHINMMDLLQQYAIGNDMQDFSQLPSKTVTEVLMLEMKMAPAAKTYLISGYPRSMRDVVEYSEKIQVINGVILISWRQGVLQKQIDYGAKLGHVVLSLAKMELENFFKSVMPVADYFDQSDMLVAINGERTPSEVYKDFRAAVLDILQTQENQEAVLNGVAGIGHGIDDIPGSIVSVDTAPSPTKTKVVDTQIVPEVKSLPPPQQPRFDTPPPPPPAPSKLMNGNIGRNVVEIESFEDQKTTVGNARYPPIVFVIGGPGSSKSTLCLKAIQMNPGWGHFSVGKSLRALAESEPKPMTENFAIKEAIAAGEMVSRDSLEKLIHSNILQLMNKKGIIIDGYPREMNQILDFQDKYNQKPPIILLDCSKLQLGRGRLDDTVSSFRRRLELFRELTLPMLKAMDADGRLTIVDGDTDSSSVQREFEKVVRQQIEKLGGSNLPLSTRTNFNKNGDDYRQNEEMTSYSSGSGGLFRPNGVTKANIQSNDEYIEDLEEHMPGAIPTISRQVSNHMSLANGHIGSTNSGKVTRNRPPGVTNGYVSNGRSNFRSMLEDAEMNSHI